MPQAPSSKLAGLSRTTSKTALPITPVPYSKDDDGRVGNSPAADSLVRGYAALSVFSVLVGTFYPATSLLYQRNPDLDPAAFNAARTLIASLSVLVLSLLFSPSPVHRESARLPSIVSIGTTAGKSVKPANRTLKTTLGTWYSSLRGSLEVRAGLELGVYNFLGGLCQVEGLKWASATKAAFLGQLTTVFVPLLSWLSGDRLTLQVVMACVLAFSGTAFVEIDKAGSLESNAKAVDTATRGEVLMVASCLFHAIMVVRLGKTARQCGAVGLARIKLGTTAALASLFCAANGGLRGGMGGLAAVSGATWGWMAYLGVVPGGVATVLQVYGQSSVPPAMSQVLYSMVPLWAAAIAQALGTDAGMGPWGWTGGLLILAAGVLTVIQTISRKTDRA